MDRRTFLQTMGIAAAGYGLPSLAAERIAPATVAHRIRRDESPLSSIALNLEEWHTRIKCVGVGDAGGNAIEHIIRVGLPNVECLAFNTDAQALARNIAPLKLTLGRTGLGASGEPETGRAAAEESREAIHDALSGTHMIFLSAGMGGGTGSGAAPVIAQVAQELGILTVGVVTRPFSFEGKRHQEAAEAGIAELSKRVDSLIVVPNDKLLHVLVSDAGVGACFRNADDNLTTVVRDISNIITYTGLVGVDFEDVRTVVGDMGRANVGSGVAAGSNRARIAAKRAMEASLLNADELAGARGILVIVTASKEGLKLKEVHDVISTVETSASDKAHIMFGTAHDAYMEESLRVTVIATGLDQPNLHYQSNAEATETRQRPSAWPAIRLADFYDIPEFMKRLTG